MTEMKNPVPDGPGGPSAMNEESRLADSEQMLDGGSSGTDEGPAGLPANMVGEDKDGDPVATPPAATDDSGTDVTEQDDALSPSDQNSPSASSAGRSESASGSLGG